MWAVFSGYYQRKRSDKMSGHSRILVRTKLFVERPLSKPYQTVQNWLAGTRKERTGTGQTKSSQFLNSHFPTVMSSYNESSRKRTPSRSPSGREKGVPYLELSTYDWFSYAATRGVWDRWPLMGAYPKKLFVSVWLYCCSDKVVVWSAQE